MYNPPVFRETDPARIHDFIDAHNFGILVIGEEASHLPFLLDRGAGPYGTLYAHMARANQQWQSFARGQALVIFSGPHSYISPIHYRDTIPVPTWNYVAVHAYGTPRIIEEVDGARSLLRRMVAKEEARNGTGWTMDTLERDTADGLIGQIAAFAIPLERLEGKWKLGQNRDAANRRRAAEALLQTNDPMREEVGRLMLETI